MMETAKVPAGVQLVNGTAVGPICPTRISTFSAWATPAPYRRPAQAFREFHRVLKPGGKITALNHLPEIALGQSCRSRFT